MKVFKYRGSNNKGVFERDLKSIEKNYFWSSNFEDLNDPWENIVISEKFYEQTKSFTSFFFGKNNDAISKLNQAFENLLSHNKKLGVYSLSKNSLDELLWAHYANSHKGFCIEYDYNVLISSFKTEKVFPLSVIYDNTPPEISIEDIKLKGSEILHKMAAYKSKRWEYEEEFRVITDSFGKQSYDYNAVTAIYFGARMDKSEKEEMMRRLKGRNIKFYQVELVEKSYLLKASLVENIYEDGVKYLTEVPSIITGKKPIKYTIENKIFHNWNSRGEVTINIESIISEKELLWLADIIREEVFHTAETIYIYYYLRNEKKEDVLWATSHIINDKIEISINDI